MHEKSSGWARTLSLCKNSFSFDGQQFLLHIKMLQKKMVKPSSNAGDSGGPLLLVDRGSKATVIGVVRYFKFLH
jgi:hypothetical protein